MSSSQTSTEPSQDTRPEDKKSKESEVPEYEKELTSLQLGVRKIWMKKEDEYSIKANVLEFYKRLPLIQRFLSEVFWTNPRLVTVYMLMRLCSGIENAVLLYLTSQFLALIASRLEHEGSFDVRQLVASTVLRLTFVALIEALKWWSDQLYPILSHQVKTKFEIRLLDARLRDDLLIGEEAAKDQITASRLFYCFTTISWYLTNLLETASQVVLVMHSSQTKGGIPFALICIVKPIFETMTTRSLWDVAHCVATTNPAYLRIQALANFAADSFKSDVISGNLKGYLLSEYTAATKALGDISTDDASDLYQQRSTPLHTITKGMLSELPMVFFAVMAILKPASMSIATVAILQQSSSAIGWSVERLLQDATHLRQKFAIIAETYEFLDAPHKESEEETSLVSYPPSDADSKGMRLELRDVAFTYPGTKAKKDALEGINLNIKPGSLVIIVGENGSGKSTLVKLLSRMYDPTSGTVDVDGQPMKDYFVGDLRRATALLSQDHNVFPLSMKENIGLGNVEAVDNVEAIQDAVIKGGAKEYIDKLDAGLDTTLESFRETYSINLPSDRKHPLKQLLKSMRDKATMSGGERQRIVAARTFMTFSSGRIRLCLVDEPTSAIDAAGELNLFTELLNHKEGKTMIFVTHRFGHLTKHADMIVCMKSGRIEELGTHTELMAKDGEYANLFNIQAQAFASDSASASVESDDKKTSAESSDNEDES